MAWSGSAIFQAAMINPLLQASWTTAAPTGYGSLSADVIDCALFGTLTPNKAAAVGATGYTTGVWTAGNEASGTGYTAGGKALTSKTFAIDTGSSSVCFTAASPSWSTVTLTGVFGCLIYDNTVTGGTVANQGLCYNYFGGSTSVTSGSYTVNWATPSGGAVTAVFNITV